MKPFKLIYVIYTAIHNAILPVTIGNIYVHKYNIQQSQYLSADSHKLATRMFDVLQ